MKKQATLPVFEVAREAGYHFYCLSRDAA